MPQKGYRHSEETKRKIGNANKGHSPWIRGKKHSKETIEKMKGREVSDETRKKLSEAMIGKPQPWKWGEKHHDWKGENAKYRTIHTWVNARKERPEGCTKCGEVRNRMSWANIDHKYRRVLDDYMFLCPRCHGEYDKINNLRKRK
jgi:hypothetical protein